MEKITTRTLKTASELEDWRNSREYMLGELQNLATLRFDWDGQSALPAREDVLRDLRFRVFGESYGMDTRNLPIPAVSLDQHGSVVIVYSKTPRELTLVFLCCHVVKYYKTSMSGLLVEGMLRLPDGPIVTGVNADIDELTEWLLTGE